MDNNPVTYQHVTLKYFEALLQEKVTDLTGYTTKEREADIVLTYEEENAVHYMSGYVVRKLQRLKYSIEFLILKGDDVVAEESTEWISLIDRGGLVHVTNECFQLFLSMETVMRRHLECHETRTGIFKNMESILLYDNGVLFDWLMITGNEEEHKDILIQLVKQWVVIRGHSFGKSILEEYKQAAKKSTNKSKGLRTKLFTDQL